MQSGWGDITGKMLENITFKVRFFIAILNQQKYIFFRIGEQEVKTSSVWGLVPVGREEDIR
jgi:hypothetical protein